MKILILFIACYAFEIDVDKTNNDSEVDKYLLTGQWLFKTDFNNQGTKNRWYKSDVDISGWEKMSVPGNWDLKNEYAEFGGIAWYRKSFEASELWQDKAVRLYFESVYNDAEVWMNGELIGKHQIGFLPFWFDIQDQLQFGEANTIVLRVDNTFKRGAIWNWGGIRRPVWLEITNEVRLERQQITALPDLNDGSAYIDVEMFFSSQNNRTVDIGYEMIVKKNGEPVWRSDAENREDHLTISPEEKISQNVSFELPESKVDLWHFNHPHLYTSEIRLFRQGKQIHHLSDRFGIRKIEVNGESFLLNGEPIRTVGFNLVAEDRTTGNTLPKWRIKEDVDLMKSLGANMARLSHNPLPKDFLDYLDEQGIMVLEEVSVWQKDLLVHPDHPLPKYWLEKMIKLRYNHPSIIGWSVGNEIGWHHHNPEIMEYVKSATDLARVLDPNRLALYVSSSADEQEFDAVKYSDMIMFNSYGNWGQRAAWVNENHPGKPIFIAEYNDHLNEEDLNEAFIDFEAILGEYRGRPYVMGASLWTFNDYRSLWRAGETWTTPPSQNRTWGVVDVFRQKKRPYFDLKREYAPVNHFTVELQEEYQKAEVGFDPRKPFDIPAYIMKDYSLVWSVSDNKGKVIEGGFEDLPLIYPGSESISRTIQWNSKDIMQLRVYLLDPQQYSVRDTSIYFSTPEPPEIKSVHVASNRIRVLFNHVENTEGYKVHYGKNDFSNKTDLTINDYIQIDNLEHFGNYNVKVVAINNVGASEPSIPVKVQLDRSELPPVVRKTVPSDGSFFVGYSVDRIDYMYQVKYGTEPDTYTNKITSRTFGVLQVPGLKNGQTYYYRMRTRKQQGFDSDWTHEIKVTPDGGLPPQKPIIHGVLRKGSKALIHLSPVAKVVGYEIKVYKDGRIIQEKSENRSHIEYIMLEELSEGGDYVYSIKSVNEYGMSEPVQFR